MNLLHYISCLFIDVFRGMRVEFLPPYSPDLNPIEQAFLTIKMRLKREGNLARTEWSERDDTEVYLRLYKLVFSITSREAFSFYHHSRYV